MHEARPHGRTRWRFLRLRRVLRPASRPALDAWVAERGRSLHGLIANVGAGEDRRVFGARTIRIDAHAPDADVRADLDGRLPFEDASFDGALCTEVLEHVRRPDQVLAEIARILKPGAALIVTVPFYFHYHPDPEDFTRFSPPGLESALGRAGFEVDFLAGLGGRFVAALLLLEGIHPLMKLVVRVGLMPVQPLLARRRPVHRRWSDFAANVVAIARRSHAGR